MGVVEGLKGGRALGREAGRPDLLPGNLEASHVSRKVTVEVDEDPAKCCVSMTESSLQPVSPASQRAWAAGATALVQHQAAVTVYDLGRQGVQPRQDITSKMVRTLCR